MLRTLSFIRPGSHASVQVCKILRLQSLKFKTIIDHQTNFKSKGSAAQLQKLFIMCKSVGLVPSIARKDNNKDIFFIENYYTPSWIPIRFKMFMQKAPILYTLKI